MAETGLQRRIDVSHTLKAFDILETFEFIERRCHETGWQFDRNSFVPALFWMSGGIPYLLQQIGAGACRIAERRDSSKSYLTAEDVTLAVAEDQNVDRAVEVAIRSGLRFDLKEYLTNDYERKILPRFYRAWSTDRINWARSIPEVINGLAKNEWKTRVLDPFDKTQPYQDAFNRLWEALNKHGVILHRQDAPGKFAFCSEAIRRYFNRFDPR